MKYTLLIYLWIAIAGITFGQNDSLLSRQAQVSLLTFDPGDEVYSIWGHTAIRINDPAQNLDEVYNYGTFDFDQPWFLWKFLRGKLDYSLEHDPFDKVIYFYKYFKRGITEQVLNLDHKEKNRLYAALIENYKKENRYYKYDFFFDNCSTRPLNIIEKSINGKLLLKKPKPQLTFRQLLDKQIHRHKWTDFGIDLIIGNRADKIPTPKQSVFLPFNLMRGLSKAKIQAKPDISAIKTNKTVIKKMVKSESEILDIKNKMSSTPLLLRPIWIFTFLLLLEIVLFYFSYKSKRLLYVWYDKLWFVVAFAGSMVIIFLWFFTDHIATKNNWNLIWLNPLYIFLLFKGEMRKTAAIIILILLFLTLIGFSFFPQELNPAIIPILGLLLLKVSKYAFWALSYQLPTNNYSDNTGS